LFELVALRRPYSSRSRFDRIDEHEDRRLLGLRLHPRVAEVLLAQTLRISLLDALVPEKFDDLRSMMGVRELDDRLGDVFVAQDLRAEHDMRHDGVGRDVRLEIAV